MGSGIWGIWAGGAIRGSGMRDMLIGAGCMLGRMRLRGVAPTGGDTWSKCTGGARVGHGQNVWGAWQFAAVFMCGDSTCGSGIMAGALIGGMHVGGGAKGWRCVCWRWGRGGYGCTSG